MNHLSQFHTFNEKRKLSSTSLRLANVIDQATPQRILRIGLFLKVRCQHDSSATFAPYSQSCEMLKTHPQIWKYLLYRHTHTSRGFWDQDIHTLNSLLQHHPRSRTIPDSKSATDCSCVQYPADCLSNSLAA